MRKRLPTPTPALVISLVALFVALGGTSLAATSYIKGTHIKPHSIPKNRLTASAVRELHGARGSRGPQGIEGPQGLQGTQGIEGPKGDTGDIGPSNAYSGYFAPAYGIGGAFKKVVSQTLGAGSYVVAAKTSITMPTAQGTTCKLEDSIQGELDKAGPAGANGATDLGDTVSLLAPLTTTGSQVSVSCGSNDPAATVAFTHIVAIKLGSVTGN